MFLFLLKHEIIVFCGLYKYYTPSPVLVLATTHCTYTCFKTDCKHTIQYVYDEMYTNTMYAY